MHKTIDRSTLRTGHEVYSTDGTHLGTVQDVGEDYVLVQKGLFFPRDVYVPITAIDRTEDDSLWLNVHKNDIDSAGWDTPPAASRDTATIPVHEEELEVRKSAHQAGEVQVRKDVVEEHRNIDVPVTREEVRVSRIPVDRPATDAELSFREGEQTFRIPVMEEDVEVSKRARVKEEIQIDKVAREDTEQVGGTVRREEVRVTKGPDETV